MEAGAMNGALLETYVFAEILKSYWHNAKQPQIYFYRDKDRREIDFVIESDNTLYPIEVKKSVLPDKRAGKNFDVLKTFQKNVAAGVILSLKSEVFYLTENLVSVPVWAI